MEAEFESRPVRPGSLNWSEDNILALLTSSILHIFAPSLSRTFEKSPVKFTFTSAPAPTTENDSPPWRLMSDVASMRNAMTRDIDFVMTAWSPTGCTRLKGCMLACITSKHSVFLYVPSSSHVDKQWKKHVVLDRYIAEHWGAGEEVDLEMAEKIETTSLVWSPKIFVDNIGAVLALGNKTGRITIWHVTDSDSIRCIKEFQTESDTWIVRMSFSPWLVGGDRYESTLAYATADGVVRARKVSFSSTAPLDDIGISENIMASPSQTFHPCTFMRWSPTATESASKPSMLAFSKGNRLNVWFPETNQITTWRKPIAKAIADITWDVYGSLLYVFFMDGKHSVLRLHGDELKVDEEIADYIHQEIISKCHVQERTNVVSEEGETENIKEEDEDGDDEAGGGMAPSKLQLHIISGERSVGSLQLATLYYVTSPFHMEFQRERFQSCTVVFSKAHMDTRGDAAEAVFERLLNFICLPNAVVTRNPSYQLWELLLLLANSTRAEVEDRKLIQGLLDVLDTGVFNPGSDVEILAMREALPTVNTSPESKLEAAIFNEPSITANRICIYLWTQLQNSFASDKLQEDLEHRAIIAKAEIRKHCTRSILEQLLAVSTAASTIPMKESDQTLFLLLCDSILLFHYKDNDLVTLAAKTYGILHRQLQDLCHIEEQMGMLEKIQKGKPLKDRSFSFGRERCPACEGEVKLESETQGTCSNGHTWQRCAVSLLLISDFHPRTCLGCRRKTLMVPDDAQAREASAVIVGSKASSWLEIILRASSVCCFCGERYFTALRRRG